MAHPVSLTLPLLFYFQRITFFRYGGLLAHLVLREDPGIDSDQE
jgi:hypothetical protein